MTIPFIVSIAPKPRKTPIGPPILWSFSRKLWTVWETSVGLASNSGEVVNQKRIESDPAPLLPCAPYSLFSGRVTEEEGVRTPRHASSLLRGSVRWRRGLIQLRHYRIRKQE